jgi:hypothetical protein
VVEHHGRVGHGIDQVDELRQLRVVHPRIEAQAHATEHGIAFAERGVEQQVFRRRAQQRAHLGAGVPRGHVADAAKALGRARHAGFEHLLREAAQPQVDLADDAGRHANRPVDAAGAHGPDAVDELDLAHARHARVAVGAVHRAAFDEHGAAHMVAGVEVGQDLGQQVAVVRAVPQVVVRIDDGAGGVEHRLVAPREPFVVDEVMRRRAALAGVVVVQGVVSCMRCVRWRAVRAVQHMKVPPLTSITVPVR